MFDLESQICSYNKYTTIFQGAHSMERSTTCAHILTQPFFSAHVAADLLTSLPPFLSSFSGAYLGPGVDVTVLRTGGALSDTTNC